MWFYLFYSKLFIIISWQGMSKLAGCKSYIFVFFNVLTDVRVKINFKEQSFDWDSAQEWTLMCMTIEEHVAAQIFCQTF
jgi:hypothetical protein